MESQEIEHGGSITKAFGGVGGSRTFLVGASRLTGWLAFWTCPNPAVAFTSLVVRELD